MDSLQLRYALLTSIYGHTFVCAADQLDQINNDSFFIICNNEPKDKAGQHWLALLKFPSTNEILFFDSFAMPIEFYGNHFCSFVKKHAKSLRYSEYQYQSDSSNVCGGYCLYVLINCSKGRPFNDVLSDFSLVDKNINDNIIKNFVDKFHFPKFSNCYLCCKGQCKHTLNSVCIQKSRHCTKLGQKLSFHDG